MLGDKFSTTWVPLAVVLCVPMIGCGTPEDGSTESGTIAESGNANETIPIEDDERPTNTARGLDEASSGKPSDTQVSPPSAKDAKPNASQQWGSLRGRFVYDATPPQQEELKVTSDIEYCGAHHPVDESLVVNKTNAGLANVVVSLYVGRGDPAPPVHPSYDATAQDKVTIDNLKCRFSPHVLLLRTSQTLLIMNSDAIAHNTNIVTIVNPPINPTLPASGTLEHHFAVPEPMPVRVSCNIHPWMSAWIIVRQDPYAAVTDRDGRFEIKDLPVGPWTFQVWHEKAYYITEARIDDQKLSWKRGRFVREIVADETVDLGEVRIRPELFSDG